MSTLSQPIHYQLSRPNRILKLSANICFGIVVVGQVIFSLYVFGLYGVNGLAGDFEKWNEASSHGYVEKDLFGNVIFGVHMFFAIVITIGGPLQLIAKVRDRFPKFHRINGRVYIFSALLMSIGGLYLSWVRGNEGGLIGSIFISINAAIIMSCAFFTVKNAVSRQLRNHRKWAIRLFLAVSGVWFFRVFLMLWFMIFQAPVGIDVDTFQGPTLNMLYVVCYILPVIGLEIYFRISSSSKRVGKWALATFVFLMTGGIALGTVAATLGMWLPSL